MCGDHSIDNFECFIKINNENLEKLNILNQTNFINANMDVTITDSSN